MADPDGRVTHHASATTSFRPSSRAFERRKPIAMHRTHSIEFKRQVAQEFLAGETLHGLSKRHDVCRNLIRIWV